MPWIDDNFTRWAEDQIEQLQAQIRQLRRTLDDYRASYPEDGGNGGESINLDEPSEAETLARSEQSAEALRQFNENRRNKIERAQPSLAVRIASRARYRPRQNGHDTYGIAIRIIDELLREEPLNTRELRNRLGGAERHDVGGVARRLAAQQILQPMPGEHDVSQPHWRINPRYAK